MSGHIWTKKVYDLYFFTRKEGRSDLPVIYHMGFSPLETMFEIPDMTEVMTEMVYERETGTMTFAIFNEMFTPGVGLDYPEVDYNALGEQIGFTTDTLYQANRYKSLPLDALPRKVKQQTDKG